MSDKTVEVPENVMRWMIVQGWTTIDVRTDESTVPPSYFFTMKLENTDKEE